MSTKTEREGTSHAVVIAGGGPTGLTLAAELAIAGVDVVVIEPRESQTLPGTRAGGFHARTIELFDQRGVAERFLSAGRTMQIASFAGTTLDLSDCPTRHPYGLALGQVRIEEILAEWARELGVRFLRGRRVVDFSQDDEAVGVVLDTGEELRAQYLVGCDGGRSLIRKTAGIGFPGWEPSVSYLLAEVEMTEEPASGMRRDAKGTYAMGRMEDGERVRVVLREEEVRSGDSPTLEELRVALVGLYGTDFGVRPGGWISRFTDGTRQASSLGERRVLLAGDAAHVHSPMGGQGLNLGVHDAFNLGWKLAAVVRREAPASLLESYHDERHPVIAETLRTTMAQTALSRAEARTEAAREAVADLLSTDEPRRRYAAKMSGLDLRYPLGDGHPLIGRRMPDLDLVTSEGARRTYALLHAARPLLVELAGTGAAREASPWSARLTACTARYEGPWQLPAVGEVPAPSAALIRPDGYVAWAATSGVLGLREALARWLGPA